LYAYDRALLRATLPSVVKVHYAMRANVIPALVGFMTGLADGIDVAAAGKLKVALDTVADPREISFAGPGKRKAELRQAVTSRLLFNVERMRKVRLLPAILAELAAPSRLARIFHV
jgi:diaminopimelate decarboxylase